MGLQGQAHSIKKAVQGGWIKDNRQHQARQRAIEMDIMSDIPPVFSRSENADDDENDREQRPWKRNRKEQEHDLGRREIQHAGEEQGRDRSRCPESTVFRVISMPKERRDRSKDHGTKIYDQEARRTRNCFDVHRNRIQGYQIEEKMHQVGMDEAVCQNALILISTEYLPRKQQKSISNRILSECQRARSDGKNQDSQGCRGVRDHELQLRGVIHAMNSLRWIRHA